MKTTVIALEKGGVGKTTTAQHVAVALARMGRRVLLIDFDPQGSLSKRFDLSAAQATMADVLGVGGENEQLRPLAEAVIGTHEQNLYLAPSDERLASTGVHLDRSHGTFDLHQVLRNQATGYDNTVIDTAPGRSMLQTVALVAADEIVCPVELSPMGLEGWVQIDGQVGTARQHQQKLGQVRLAYRAVVPTKYAKGQDVSDTFLQLLTSREHPDYEGMPLPVSPPVVQTTLFEKCSAPRLVRANGHTYRRAVTIFELSDEIAQRAGEAYMALAQMVDTYV